MCFIKPLKVTKVIDNKYLLNNRIKAIADKNIGRLKVGDKVVVYGNLIISKIYESKKL